MILIDHLFDVPLDHDDPGGERIEVFAREARAPGGEGLPWLVYLQGGPGGRSPRPLAADGWLARALKTHRVLLLDQRGTGRSAPADLASRDARYFSRLRADAIVRDCEHIRRAMGVERWETLGQSYGGFVTLTYLSMAPEALKACYVAGGLPSVSATADDVYARTYPRVLSRTRQFYRRHPADAERVRAILDRLSAREVLLPDGDRLTPHRFRTLGLGLGMGAGFERLHWLIEDGERLSDDFLDQVMRATSFTANPLFALMQESIYGQGGKPTAWAAERALADHPSFAPAADSLLFTGEMIYPWMFDEIRSLRPYARAAHELAAIDDWPPLYDAERLAANRVPVAAVVYHDDMYVDAGLSLETAETVGNVRVWVTNEWQHDGLTASGERVLDRLMNLAL
ncbi:alpha/beta fold hydrolase [Nonomuraea sp. NPDC049152]|uniref:alpha/beta fold hydrolase n=1 Tax=Nonomuraea sp. NPDC049152 TaxID=3154350 RepID=UPI003403F8B1